VGRLARTLTNSSGIRKVRVTLRATLTLDFTYLSRRVGAVICIYIPREWYEILNGVHITSFLSDIFAGCMTNNTLVILGMISLSNLGFTSKIEGRNFDLWGV
jgi:hypothetical protein